MYEFLYGKVQDVMSSSPVTVAPGATLAAVAKVFDEYDFNALPVVEGSGRLVGLVTKVDLLRAFAFGQETVVPHYDEIMQQRIDRVMTAEPETFHPDEPLTRVLQRMVDTHFKSFPVVVDRQLVGVIAREDIVRALRSITVDALH